jgi:ATP-dependent DNA helicase DinG
VASYDEAGAEAITKAREAAEALPGDGWLQRVVEGALGRSSSCWPPCAPPPLPAMKAAGRKPAMALKPRPPGWMAPYRGRAEGAGRARLRVPLISWACGWKRSWPNRPTGSMAGPRADRGRAPSLGWRVDLIAAWEALLARLAGPADPAFVDWLAVERGDGREFDMGLHRRWLDPMQPFAATVLAARMA